MSDIAHAVKSIGAGEVLDELLEPARHDAALVKVPAA
jgi:hypothetical protein